VSSFNWPFRILTDDNGMQRVSPIGFPNCEGIGSDIETAKQAGSTALSFVFDSGIAQVPTRYPDLAIASDELDGSSITEIRIELRR
jgi:hypothetical protein